MKMSDPKLFLQISGSQAAMRAVNAWLLIPGNHDELSRVVCDAGNLSIETSGAFGLDRVSTHEAFVSAVVRAVAELFGAAGILGKKKLVISIGGEESL